MVKYALLFQHKCARNWKSVKEFRVVRCEMLYFRETFQGKPAYPGGYGFQTSDEFKASKSLLTESY